MAGQRLEVDDPARVAAGDEIEDPRLAAAGEPVQDHRARWREALEVVPDESPVGAVSAAATMGMKIFSGADMTGNPLLLLAIFSAMVSIQFFSLGLLGEVSARIYYGSQQKQHYAVRELINFERAQLHQTTARAA